MNPYSAGALGIGINQATQNFQTTRMSEDERLARRRQLQMQEQTQAAQMSGYTQQSQFRDLQMQQMQQQMQQMQLTATKKDAQDAFLAAMRTGNPNHLNRALKENPVIAKQAKDGGIVGYKSLDEYSEEVQKDLGFDAATAGDLKNYLYVQERADGSRKLYDVSGALIAMGGAELMDKRDKDLLTKKVQEAQLKLTQMQTAGAESELALSTEQNNIMLEAVKTKDASKVMEALRIVKPDEFVAKPSSGKMDSLTQLLTAMELGDIPESDRVSLLASFAKKMSVGTKASGEDYDVNQLSASRKEATDLWTQPEWDNAKARSVEDKILYDLPDTEKEAVKRVQKTLEANSNTATNIDKIIAGDLPAADKDVIANSRTWIASKLGAETAQDFANVNFNTKAGIMLAAYIKEISGTAASQPEVDRLLTNLFAGNFTDERYIRQSMESFSAMLKQMNETAADKYKDTLPYTIGKTVPSMLPKKKDERPPMESFSGTAKPSLSSFGTGKAK